jgi:hypothetical protein
MSFASHDLDASEAHRRVPLFKTVGLLAHFYCLRHSMILRHQVKHCPGTPGACRGKDQDTERVWKYSCEYNSVPRCTYNVPMPLELHSYSLHTYLPNSVNDW